MTSIHENDHGEQEVEDDEYETVWVPADQMQEDFSAQQRIGDLHMRVLEDQDRIHDLIDPPVLRALRRIDQIAANSMPAWMENLRRTEEMLYRARGLRPVQHPKKRANTPIGRQAHERPLMPPRRECAPPVAPSQTSIAPLNHKRGPGRQKGDTWNDREEFEATLVKLVHEHVRREHAHRPTQREVADGLPYRVSVDTVQNYSREWFGGWRGVLAHCDELFSIRSSTGRINP